MGESNNQGQQSQNANATGAGIPPTPPPGFNGNNDNGPAEPKSPSKKRRTIAIVVSGMLLLVAVVVVAMFATNSICFHEWSGASCKEPKTCTICGKTDGFARGHDFKKETCAEPKICKVCGLESGKPNNDHKVKEWTTDIEPTCTDVGEKHGSCSVCGETITGEVVTSPHTEGEWTVISDFAVSPSGNVVPGKKVLTCSVCGAEMMTKDYTIDLTMGQKNALKKAASYLSFTSFSYSRLVDQLEFEGFSNEDSIFAVDHCGADWNEQAAKKAESYLEFTSFSRDRLIDQLEFEGFTYDQAVYGVTAVGY